MFWERLQAIYNSFGVLVKQGLNSTGKCREKFGITGFIRGIFTHFKQIKSAFSLVFVKENAYYCMPLAIIYGTLVG
ncbi:hypothetical protein EZS27_017481 [termite gut metagenome]|uniref:Uncharacterized protein n=1 Tax=termite gut metagenome TaxID=433724 RepID=A0A5J4RKM9_9ZZZZ